MIIKVFDFTQFYDLIIFARKTSLKNKKIFRRRAHHELIGLEISHRVL